MRQRGTGIVVDETEVALVVLNTHADVTFCTVQSSILSLVSNGDQIICLDSNTDLTLTGGNKSWCSQV